MKILNNNPLDLSADNGETISVSVTANGTVNAVTFNLNDAAWSGGSFVVNKATKSSYVLVVFVVFSNPNSGVYTITLAGSHGGSSTYTITQLPNQASNAIAFTIDIV